MRTTQIKIYLFLSTDMKTASLNMYVYFRSLAGQLFSLKAVFVQISDIFKTTLRVHIRKVKDWLRSLRTNERLWANHSGHSSQKSDREQIAQVAHNKWATVSDFLRLLMINEQIASFFWANRWFALSLTKNERFPKNSFY